MTTEEKITALRAIIHEAGSLLVAFSGGVDSTFLLKVALEELGGRAAAVTISAPAYPAFELADAERLARSMGACHHIIRAAQLDIPGLNSNPPDRCYICKKELFKLCRKTADEHGLALLVDGSNADDALSHRPGKKALLELGVRSPLQEAGLTKVEIRAVSRQLGLPTWDKQPYACLLTRFPHGDELTLEKLAMVERCEEYLHTRGVRQFRVRVHGELARIELGPLDLPLFMKDENRRDVASFFRQAGFRHVALDLEGYRTGSMD